MNLDLRHIESFIAVAENRSFSIAADKTGTVQSAVSAHIRALERTLARRLVDRGRGKPVELTPAGAAFLVQARRVMGLLDEALHDRAATTPPLRLGTTVTFALSVVPAALAAFANDEPRRLTQVLTARSHELLDRLEDGTIDIALVLDQGPRSGRIATVPVGLAWASAPAFPQPVPSPLPLAFLEDARDLRRHALAALDAVAGIDAVIQTHGDPIGLRAAVLAGCAVTVLPQPAVAQPLEDVGARLGLPVLGSIPVSIYVSALRQQKEAKRLAGHLASALR